MKCNLEVGTNKATCFVLLSVSNIMSVTLKTDKKFDCFFRINVTNNFKHKGFYSYPKGTTFYIGDLYCPIRRL